MASRSAVGAELGCGIVAAESRCGGCGGSLALVQCRAGDSPACISSGEENGICGRDLD